MKAKEVLNTLRISRSTLRNYVTKLGVHLKIDCHAGNRNSSTRKQY